MPVIKDHVKYCLCCGKKSVSYELIFICSKCLDRGHKGLSCELCKDKNKKKDE